MVTRWNPFDEALSLREAMNQLFETSVVRPGQAGAGQGGWQAFPLNLYGRGDDLVVEALLPGVSPEDVQVAVDRGVLSIAATRHGWEPGRERDGDLTWYRHEVAPGQFKRALSLPFPVDVDKAQADYRDGVLSLTLPKAEAARPKQIKITARAPEQVKAGGAK